MALIKLNNNSISAVTALPAGVGGKVLQVVQGTTTTEVSITSATWTDTTLTASITPSSATNKILVLVNQHFNIFRALGFAGGSLRLVRGATTIYAGDINFQLYMESNNSTQVNFYDYVSLNYLDSPSSTSALTYKTQQRSYDPGDRAKTQTTSAEATITLIEIEG